MVIKTMREMTLIRAPSTVHGTFGMLLDEGIPFCLTLERPWLENEIDKSCIPSGMYMCKRFTSPKFGETFSIIDVPERKDIEFHIGNFITDTTGCIILGEQFEPINGIPAVRSSGIAFDEFIGKLKWEDKFILYILWAK